VFSAKPKVPGNLQRTVPGVAWQRTTGLDDKADFKSSAILCALCQSSSSYKLTFRKHVAESNIAIICRRIHLVEAATRVVQ
jgi:hypothetical protein